MMSVVVVDKCQGTITTHLRCGVPFSYHITLNLSLSSAVKEFLADRTIGRAYATVSRLSVVRRPSSVRL